MMQYSETDDGRVRFCCVIVAGVMLMVHAEGIPVLPRPQEMRGSGRALALVGPACLEVRPSVVSRPDLRSVIASGRGLLRRRLDVLGIPSADRAASDVEGGFPVVFDAVTAAEMVALLMDSNVPIDVSVGQVAEAYVLRCSQVGDQAAIVLSAAGGRGFYYGVTTLCQLLDADGEGGVTVPEVVVADWPAIGVRLAKTSASENDAGVLAAFALWQPVMKINVLGLQYHGRNSLAPEPPFLGNVASLCAAAAAEGVLDTVVYFCPFRGDARAYDFRRPEHCDRYVAQLNRWLDQGADGIEIDYNDWPDTATGVPIAEVINLVCSGLSERHRDAMVLYCPPIDQYRGMAGAALSSTLAAVPERVWTLWTGMTTLIDDLDRADVLAWRRRTGRRPFLWVNRVFAGGQFSRDVETGEGGYVFRGEALPRDLPDLVEGVHLNVGLSSGYNRLPRHFSREALMCLATAADFLWHPQAWESEGSLRAAQRFVDIMIPLLGEDGRVGPRPPLVSRDDPAWAVASGEWCREGDMVSVCSGGRFAVMVRRDAGAEAASGARVRAVVRTRERAGNMNGYLVCGQEPESGAYVLAGAAFASGHWVLMRALPGSDTQTMLCRAAGQIAIERGHLLEVRADYAAGTIELLEQVEGEWVSRLRHQSDALIGLRPAAGVANKWGETVFGDMATD